MQRKILYIYMSEFFFLAVHIIKKHTKKSSIRTIF